MPICFHGGGQNFLKPDFSLEVLDKLMMWHTFSQPLGIMTVLVSLTAGGVFERFPTLRAGLLEGNCSWAPWLLYRLDEHYEWLGGFEAPELRMKPSEYFRRNCFLAVEADEETVGQYVAHLRRRQPGVLDRLPARRLEVPARGRGLHAAAAVGGVAAQDPVGQLQPALRHQGADGGTRRGAHLKKFTTESG